jgi:YfiH family protein
MQDWIAPFPQLDWLRGGCSLRADGAMSWNGNDLSEVVDNRRRYFAGLNLDLSLVVGMDQTHGFNIHYASESDAGRGAADRDSRIPDTDGLITMVQGLILTALHADCAPIFFADEAHQAIGLAHAGWRGVLSGLAGKMVQRMTAEFGTDANQLLVAIGPMISPQAYEVSASLGADFVNRFGTQVATLKDGRVHLDLFAALEADLLNSGLNPQAIPPRPPCTATNPQFSSYRREGAPVRSMLSWLYIR